MSKGFSVIILAAGKGTRFKSDRIKVLHTLMGRPMLQLVVDSVRGLKPNKIFVVVGYQKDEVKQQPLAEDLEFIIQKEQLGTAHAVLAAKTILKDSEDGDVLIINGDLPLIQTKTLKPLLMKHRTQGNALTFMTTDLDDPTGFGRVVDVGENDFHIIEEKDATPVQRRIKEINVGIYLFGIKDLFKALPKVTNQNKKGEYYLTDLIAILSRDKKKVGKYRTAQTDEIVGVNDRYELARAAEALRLRKIKSLADRGVTVLDPSGTGTHCTIYPHVHISHSKIGRGVKILASTVIENSLIKDEAQVGPFTHLRPKTVILKGARVGNFVEMKNTVFGRFSKAGHLSYLGDTEVQDSVNIGAGTITCNYDGVKKNRTLIESGAFIGSGVELVAPVKIGKKAYVGAGSTITKNVSSESLAVSRSRQIEKKGWAKRKRKK